MKQYLDLCRKTLSQGIRKKNRTGVDHIGYQGDMMKFDLSEGFPAVTTKKLAFKSVVAEMLGFLRGYTNVKDFQKLGCHVWDANAEAEYWTSNPLCEGAGDLGGIYGAQARAWKTHEPVLENSAQEDGPYIIKGYKTLDQLRKVYDDLRQGIDNRREIVTHWNPSELDRMALPPCHMFYQFGIQGDKLNLSMYQRSCDVPLGIPFNIAGYAWLLFVMARITGYKVGTFTHFMHDIHVYENQVEDLKIQMQRTPYRLPDLWISPEVQTLEDLETWVTTDAFKLIDYKHHPHIKYQFAV